MVYRRLPMVMVSPGCSSFRGTRTPLTLVPLVLPRSRTHQKPSRKVNSQCRLEMFVSRRQMSQLSRRPSVRTSRRRGILSPPPTGTNSPLGGVLMA